MGRKLLGEISETKEEGAGVWGSSRRLMARAASPTLGSGCQSVPSCGWRTTRLCGVKSDCAGVAISCRTARATGRGTVARGSVSADACGCARPGAGGRPARASGVVEGLCFDFVPPQARIERFGRARRALIAFLPPARTRSSGSWPGGNSTKRKCARVRSAEGAKPAQIAALRPALSPSKHRIGAGSSRHIRSSWASVTAVPLGATTCNSGAVERDDVHIAFDDDQAPGGTARGPAGRDCRACGPCRRAGCRGIEIFGLALAEDAPAKSDHPGPCIADRDHQAAAEAVVAVVAFVWLDQHAGLDELLLAERVERPLERGAAVGSEAEAEALGWALWSIPRRFRYSRASAPPMPCKLLGKPCCDTTP